MASRLVASIIPRFYVNQNPDIAFYLLKPGWHWNISVVFGRGFVANEATEYLLKLIREYYQGGPYRAV